MKTYLAYFSIVLAASLSRMSANDTQYSNEQEGVRLKVLHVDSDTPVLRIENRSRYTLAIHSNMSLAVSFYKNNERALAKALPGVQLGLQEIRQPLITLLTREATLEVPLRDIYFNVAPEGSGYTGDWAVGVKSLSPGKYKVKFTSNGLGMTALDLNFTPFKVNFDIPEFEYEVKAKD